METTSCRRPFLSENDHKHCTKYLPLKATIASEEEKGQETESCREVRVAVRTDVKLLKNREVHILEVVLLFLDEYTLIPQFEYYLRTIRLIWRSIPDAYLSYEEMRHVPLVFQGTCDKCVEDIIVEFQKQDFEGFASVPQPRSLMHYSR
ncbi:uncharacterized protein LOC118200811 [Stegodyphus dumicola]|uniref:uncharacterized protein LOC118200811 n=1 Tax=Stegodyphus dumicola TaxID=202533 RepID=UPI0015AD8160|nr:uncharacterized protein LOC118200811 [Stegodyphus dumicola]